MDGKSLIEIFTQGGFALVAIAVLFWLLRKLYVIFENHLSHFREILIKMNDRMSELANEISEIKGKLKEIRDIAYEVKVNVLDKKGK